MRLLFSLILALWSVSACAQVSFENVSLTDSEQNIIYKYVDNVIYISGVKNDTTLSLKSPNDGVFISKQENNKFWVSANNSKDNSSIQLDLYQKGVLQLTEFFDVKNINDPMAQLGTIKDSIATKAQILSNPTLNVIMPDCTYKHNIRVRSFEVSVSHSGVRKEILHKVEGDTIYSENIETGELEVSINPETYFTARTDGNELSNEQIDCIMKLTRDDKVIFSRIQVSSQGGCPKVLKDLIITIK